MRIISILNLKGGVGKTISAVNIAYILATLHEKKVLLIDNDKQGNSSKFYGVYSYEKPSLADVLMNQNCPIQRAIQAPKHEKIEYRNLGIISANMNLLNADRLMQTSNTPQHFQLKKSLEGLSDYDFVIIDNAPDLNLLVINALIAADDVLIPTKIDSFTFDGLNILIDQIKQLKDFNPNLKVAGCFATMYQRTNVNKSGFDYMQNDLGLPYFNTVIRHRTCVDESTFARMPLLAYDKKNDASNDYVALVEEYLGRI